MHRADFVAADGQSWWLCETQIDSRTDEARRELGIALGFTENEWFADPNRRTLLFDLLESHGSVLLNDLDYLTDDAKLEWLREATRLAAPPPAAPTQDDRTEAAQPAQADIQPVAPPPAPAKKSIFKSKAAADTTDPAQADIPPVAPPPAPAKKSIFKSKAAADTTAPALTADGAANDPAADQRGQRLRPQRPGGGPPAGPDRADRPGRRDRGRPGGPGPGSRCRSRRARNHRQPSGLRARSP